MEENLNIENQFIFYENKNNDVIKRALEDLKKEYEDKDKEIFHSAWRKSHGYIPHGTRKRTITTIFGDLTYSRHRYRHWDKYKYRFVYLSDLALGIEKYQRITNHLTIKILDLISEGKRYQDILDCFPNINFGSRTISNIIKRTKINSLQEVIETKVKKVSIKECLYINVDDTFLSLKINNKKTKFRIRVVLFHDGYNLQKSTNNKKVLNNVRIFAYLLKQKSKIDTAEFMENVYSLAKAFYNNVDDVKVIIAGDGATWIRKCSSYWPDSTYILDKFHAIRKISRVFNSNNEMLKPVNEELKQLFNNGQYNEVMTLLNQKWFDDPNKSLKLKELKSYFRTNEKDARGISNQSNPYNIGCNIESTISHNVKWLLGYGSKAFNKETYSKILDIHIAKVNGVSIVELLKEKMINKVKEKNKFFRQSFWKKEFRHSYFQGTIPNNSNNSLASHMARKF